MYRDAGEGLRAQLLLLLMPCLGVQAARKEKEMEFSRKVSVACEAACLTKAWPPLKLYYKMVYLFLQISIAINQKGTLGYREMLKPGERQGHHSEGQDAALLSFLPSFHFLPSCQMTLREGELA